MSGNRYGQVKIMLPYADAEKSVKLWVEEADQIDFRRELERAARCTLAYAALELQHYWERSFPDVSIGMAPYDDREQPNNDSVLSIVLQVADTTSRDGGFTIERTANCIVITGVGRTGTLYGVYELLRMQGWRWYAPGAAGEIIPEPADELVCPLGSHSVAASMNEGRGFDFEYMSMESGEFLKWMARNRMNVVGYRPNTGVLAHMLGMTFRLGGHIFEDILEPSRTLTSGETLWQAHEEWYGLPKSGERSIESALKTQFCVSEPALLAMLGEQVVARLQRQWYEADLLDIWGFDTWGSSCTCNRCQQVGNSTDQMLQFAAALRDAVNEALQVGRLTHPTKLILCSYEGTGTIAGPDKPIPSSLLASGDIVVVYPINRCYTHAWSDDQCTINRRYHDHLQEWFNVNERLPMMMGEYYNVSKFEDLPLVFMNRLQEDIPYYYQQGVRSMTYMHVPMTNWGLRTLTQLAYAQLMWDVETDMTQFYREYFTNWYGPYADQMQQCYSWIEEAWQDIASWRAWKGNSVLSLLLKWEGGTPTHPFVGDVHFATSSRVIQKGKQSIDLLNNVINAIDEARQLARQDFSDVVSLSNERQAVNPAEQRRINARKNVYGKRLAEDKRSVVYGRDTLELLMLLVSYYDALYGEDRNSSAQIWTQIEQVVDRLESYTIPISYEQPYAGIVSKDGLERSQLGEVVRRCRLQKEAQN